ncbi:MAG TPA: site-2 protease family protein, partial [Blastocatellia bacterium]|nr:site-2 protease family protein [Blastocatellia bacterium]
RILLHSLLLVCTAVTTALTGAALAVGGQVGDSIIDMLVAPTLAVVRETASGNLDPLAKGLLFTFTLLTILGAHELGHYFACRHYGIRATLPFFIPAPPTITLFGTLGAVIKIKEPIRSRRALFDIGIAGPLAGFAFALPASVVGLIFAAPAPPSVATGEVVQYHDPLLFVLILKLFGLPTWIEWNPIYWAAWGALLVTALNLFPVGQLDGGHVVYAVLGRRAHKWISRIATLACGMLAIYSLLVHQPPVYLLWTLVLLFLMKVGHPPVVEEEPLGAARVTIAIIAVLVFVLCFMRFPITTN